MSPFTRRHFVKASLAASAAAGIGQVPLLAQTVSQSSPATDRVTLGKSGLRVTRLAFGTGSQNGYVQAALGQQQFTRLVHHAYDRGIRFFETPNPTSRPPCSAKPSSPSRATPISS